MGNRSCTHRQGPQAKLATRRESWLRPDRAFRGSGISRDTHRHRHSCLAPTHMRWRAPRSQVMRHGLVRALVLAARPASTALLAVPRADRMRPNRSPPRGWPPERSVSSSSPHTKRRDPDQKTVIGLRGSGLGARALGSGLGTWDPGAETDPVRSVGGGRVVRKQIFCPSRRPTSEVYVPSIYLFRIRRALSISVVGLL